ncbi:MAG: TonB-dependent receptor, partial [Halomonas sp.]|nr:TonB-dependent receptor [Halomonas sp.]
NVTASLGIRYDRLRLEIDAAYLSDGDNSGERTFGQWSGSAGLSYRYWPQHQIYVNTGTAYETPTFAEFANPDGTGGFNPAIEPQTAWSRELGMRGRFSGGIEYDLALFSIYVSDELIPYEGEQGRTFYRNAGESEREGLELALSWQVTPHWRMTSALTLADYEFEQFETREGNYTGNRLPGLPERVWANQLTWEGLDQRFAVLEARYIGDLVADNANRVDVDSKWMVDLRAGDGWRLGETALLKAYAGVHNLLDEEHFANVRINASYGRYYEPAPGRTFYAGLELGF